MNVFTINFNNFNNFLVLKNKNNLNVLIFNKRQFFKLIVDTKINDCAVDDWSKCVTFNDLNNHETRQLSNDFNFYLKNLFISFFFKIKFNGKGFRIQSFSKKKIMNFTFGYSHMYMLYINKTKYKRINKYKYFFVMKELNAINYFKNLFRKIKPINKYTLRGLRISRTTIVKRKGRKSPNL